MIKAMSGAAVLVLAAALLCRSGDPPRKLDLAAWGGDHVGKPLPQFTGGDECLFCHRMDVGPTWAKDRHARTVREVDPGSPALAALGKELAGEIKLVLGHDRRQRFLKPAEESGRLEMLTAAWTPPARDGEEGKLVDGERPRWDGRSFGDACAGCHATAVESKTRTFAAAGLDCFVCHGDVPAKHTTEAGLALLGKKRKDPARVVTSACAQCHVRTGKSKSSGLPYPNQFVAGDNLFRDFQVDLSAEAIKGLNPADAHVLENVRDVVLLGKEEVTCLSCHDVHQRSSRKHRKAAEGRLCRHCHEATGSKKVLKSYEVHSAVCAY